MQKLSKNEMKVIIGGGDMGTGGRSSCTAIVLSYRTGDQFETPWNIKRQGLMKFADWTFIRTVCDGEEALNTSEQKLISCTCN